MKIDGNNEIVRSATADKAAQKETTPDAEFKDILKSTVARSSQRPTQIQASPPLNPMAAVQLAPLSPATRRSTVERVDHILNLLDTYRNQLADPRMTLRRIEPIVNTIAKEKEQLSSMLDAMPDNDGLKDIVQRTLITASLEIIKYNRGDYIPA